jgi:arabinose-5-phosphate isomerase
MIPSSGILHQAKAAIAQQAAAVAHLSEYIDAAFEQAVYTIFNSKGRFVISGIGKSAIIAQKIVATLNSTGTPALFMHAADAIHGDLGMIQPDDVVMIISKSGESPEIKVLVPLVKNFGNTVIALCGQKNSYLATHSDIFINSTVTEEACPNNLAPTTSTTAQMVMGDALAVCLLQLRGFSASDFAKFHPGGSLGKRMYLKVNDIISQAPPPQVSVNDNIRTIILEISSKRLGATAVLQNDGTVFGIITDGDIRRMLEQYADVDPLNAEMIASTHPKTIDANALAVDALELMKQHNITQLLVLLQQQYAGIIHLHDIIKEGII